MRVGEYGRSGDSGRRYGTYGSSPGGGMFGAVSITDGVRDKPDTEEFVGWYDRDTGDGGLREESNGKSGSCNRTVL